MNSAFKMMNSALKVMNSVFKMMQFVFKMMVLMAELRLAAIAKDDIVQYEEIVEGMIRMARMHRLGRKVDSFKTAQDAFEQLWLYHHLLNKDLVRKE